MSANLVCKEVVELLNDYLEGTLPPEEHRHVEEHLSGCDGCTRVLEQFRRTIALTGRLTEDLLSESERATLLDAFRHHVAG